MKYFVMILIAMSVVGCGTVGGAMKGAGEDLNRAGDYVKNVGR
jgi:predicted small secreted protein